MDNRAGTRYPAEVAVTVEHRDLGRLPATLRDVSVSGAYLSLPGLAESNTSPARHWFTPIRFRFRLPGDPSRQKREWRGFVTRTDGDGLAATVARPDAGARTDLMALLAFARLRARQPERRSA